jgi:hypothetical protein
MLILRQVPVLRKLAVMPRHLVWRVIAPSCGGSVLLWAPLRSCCVRLQALELCQWLEVEPLCQIEAPLTQDLLPVLLFCSAVCVWSCASGARPTRCSR